MPQAPRESTSKRKLRIGYVSPDFRKHAVARFFEGICEAHDHQQFAIYLYSESRSIDAVTRRLQANADGWYRTAGKTADEVASQVQTDQIDILVDLAGHTRGNRLDVFARRPAGIQLTYLGYPNTTGLTRIDCRITDGILNPRDIPTWTTERVARMPSHSFCFRPPDGSPEIKVRRRATDPVVFGSHHPPIKLNSQILRVWAEILTRVLHSRIILFRQSFYPAVVEELKDRMRAVGFPLERAEFRCSSAGDASYFSNYHDIDVILDTVPFNGHTMTCEALWMGVPVVTLRGNRPSGRLAASLLSSIGLQALIADTVDRYIELPLKWRHRRNGERIFKRTSGSG